MTNSWRDLDVHGRRLGKILKILDKKFDKIPKDDIDGLARIAATIGNITRQTVEIIKIVDRYEEMNEYFKVFKEDKTKIKKFNLREGEKLRQQEKRDMEDRRIEFEEGNRRYEERKAKNEIEEEKVARRAGEKNREMTL